MVTEKALRSLMLGEIGSGGYLCVWVGILGMVVRNIAGYIPINYF